MQHLLELGHRRIAMLRGYDCLVDDARYHGYAAALAEAGVALDRSLIERADFRFEPAVSAAEKILRLPDRPTGVFAANDLEALGVIEAARRLGLDVPGDLSVIGFDDSLSLLPPRLSSRRSGSHSRRWARLPPPPDGPDGGTEPNSLRVELATTLIVRESTAAPPARLGSACARRSRSFAVLEGSARPTRQARSAHPARAMCRRRAA